MLKNQSYNAKAWGHESILNFFDAHRLTTEHVYPSEWFFIQQKLRAGISVLDIGCAKGGFANILQEHLTSFSYVGVDINADMITAARQRHPKHQFHVIDNDNHHDDSDVLNSNRYDLVLCLGILHLHETWQRTLAYAWQHTQGCLIFDLRETHLATIEDKKIAYFKMDFDNGDEPHSSYTLPYNIINTGEALKTIYAICHNAAKITHFGYTQKISQLAISPIREVMANVYCIEKI